MKVCVDGIYRDATAEEEAELSENKLLYEKMQTEAPAPTPTIEERMASVEETVEAVKTILLGEET